MIKFASRAVSFIALILLAACGDGTFTHKPPVVRVPTDFPHLVAAIEGAPDGYTILLEDGVYSGVQNTNLNFGGKHLKLSSENGPSHAAIDCEAKRRLLTFDHEDDKRSIVSGLTIRNCGVNFEGAIYMLGSSPSIKKNIFENTIMTYPANGPSLMLFSSSPIIENNIFRNTKCDNLGVIEAVNDSSPRIVNNVFVGNRCPAVDIGIPQGPAPIVVNNTMVGNRVGVYLGRNVSVASHWYSNNLIFGNERGIEVPYESVPPIEDLSSVWQCNLVFGNTINYKGTADLTGRQGNLSEDPLLISVPSDLRLQASSPAKDKGSQFNAPNADFDGWHRTGLIDIGAFELHK